MQAPLRIGLLGFGYWGPNLARNFALLDSCRLTTVCDVDVRRHGVVKRLFPGCTVTSVTADLLNSPELDAVIVATPVSTHFELAKAILLAGKHVLIEKPMVTSESQMLVLSEMAAARNLVLMGDYTFLYTAPVHKIKALLDQEDLGALRYFDSVRINLGIFQSDTNVLWDLASHDVAILCFLLDEMPLSVNATGGGGAISNTEALAYLTLNYSSGFLAHIACSWASPVKIRRMLLGGDKKMVLYDDMEPTEKIKIYDTFLSVSSELEKHKLLIDYRLGDISIPKLHVSEALGGVAADFVAACQNGKQPLANATLALRVTRILEAAQRSLDTGGNRVLMSEGV